MIYDDHVVQNASRHLRILGICWRLYGVIRLVTALWLLTLANTGTVMFGDLLVRVPDPFTMMSGFHFIYGLAIAFSLACGVLGFLAGLAFLAGQRFGRTLGLIAGFFSLSSIPLGTTLGIYSLLVLLPLSAKRTPTAAPDGQPSNLRGQPVTM